jgi:hypothetical protein
MGRGRSKAKQTKVARQLKYSGGGADLARLQAELAATRTTAPEDDAGAEDDTEADDEAAGGAADLTRFLAELNAMRESATEHPDPESAAPNPAGPVNDDELDPAATTRRRRIRRVTPTDQPSDS